VMWPGGAPRQKTRPVRILEPVWRQRVDGRAGDGTMPEPALDRSGVVALVYESVAATSAQALLRSGIERGWKHRHFPTRTV
jgi:hypothetical protein